MDAIAKLQEAVQKAALDAVKDADEETADIEPVAATGVEIDPPEDDAGAYLTSCPPHTAITTMNMSHCIYIASYRDDSGIIRWVSSHHCHGVYMPLDQTP